MGDADLVVPASDPAVDALLNDVDALHSFDAVSPIHVRLDVSQTERVLRRLAETTPACVPPQARTRTSLRTGRTSSPVSIRGTVIGESASIAS